MSDRSVVESALTPKIAEEIQRGILSYTYKGVPTLKCPFDMALYCLVINTLKPGAIIEFGSNRGGSALWLADTLQALGLNQTRLLSLDIMPVCNLKDPRIEFVYCDTNNIAEHLDNGFMDSLPRPLLIIDDASHQYRQVLNVMEFFHRHSTSGDYIIIEDGVISLMNAEELHGYEGGPFQAVHAFLRKYPGQYVVDRAMCDFFGRNVTWNPDGYIQRIAERPSGV